MVTVLADTGSNTSALNRGDINLKANGPMNCGNLGLEGVLREHGLTPVDLYAVSPAGLDDGIRNEVLGMSTDDIMFCVAARGQRAKVALDLRPTPELGLYLDGGVVRGGMVFSS